MAVVKISKRIITFKSYSIKFKCITAFKSVVKISKSITAVKSSKYITALFTTIISELGALKTNYFYNKHVAGDQVDSFLVAISGN